MSEIHLTGSHDDGNVELNTSSNPTFGSIIEQRQSRRGVLGGMASVAALFGLAACDEGDGRGRTEATVMAGATGATTSGRVVTLTGTATGANSVQWIQESGPTVVLTNANTNSATFIAPSVTTATNLVFSFSGSGGNGVPTSATTTVIVGPAALGFTAIPKNLLDVVTVPAGYSVNVLYRLGDPINTVTPAYANNGTDTGFATRAGDHHDGMYFFGLGASTGLRDDTSSTRGLLAMNHENITPAYLHVNGPTSVAGARPEAEAIKEIECHGVSVIEVLRGTTGWSYVQNSTFNRRITPNTPTVFNGPVRGNAALFTAYSPTGVAGRGTINNCANGFTPWGTYLTCEENWAGYFRRSATDNAVRTAKEVASFNRYGIAQGASGANNWASVTPSTVGSTVFAKWNTSTLAADATQDFRNEANQFGWVVEVDPYDVNSVPRKRTALGRMGHEGAWPAAFVAGRKPVFYMGDDSRGEYFYKFVSATSWAAADAQATDRLAIGDKYLDNGTLYVARYDANGTGVWLPLVFGQGFVTSAYGPYSFSGQADVLINARHAADAVGATKMDRPEWAAVNPVNGEVYLTLTNNSARTPSTTDAANPRAYNDPKGAAAQTGNPNGHIIRLREAGNTPEAVSFTWDVYAFGAGSDLNAANINLSGLDATNDFSSPDGLWFGRPQNASGLVNPLLWIQTDDGAYTDQTNNQMLLAQPGVVGDGGARTITNTVGAATGTQSTFVGKAPAMTLRRFLVGPKECEITGIDSTPDGRTIFVNIQHPGELGSAATPTSSWPASQTGGTGSRPRSATIVITKDDTGVVGL